MDPVVQVLTPQILDVQETGVADDVLEAIKSYYDVATIFRILGFFVIMMVTFFLSWAVPAMLQGVMRAWQLEVDYTSKAYKKMLINYYLKTEKKETPTSSSSSNQPSQGGYNLREEEEEDESPHLVDIYVKDDYREINKVKIYLTTNVPIIIYRIIGFTIFVGGLIGGFLLIRQDPFAVLASFGIGSFVAMMQVPVYAGQISSHFSLLFTSKVCLGNIVTLPSSGISGMVVNMGLLYTTLLRINPRHNFNSKKASNEATTTEERRRGLYYPPATKQIERAPTRASEFYGDGPLTHHSYSRQTTRSNARKGTLDYLEEDSLGGPALRDRDNNNGGHRHGSLTLNHYHHSNHGRIVSPLYPGQGNIVADYSAHQFGLTKSEQQITRPGLMHHDEITNLDLPFRGKFFHMNPEENDHLAFDTEFIETQVPNYDLNFGIICVTRE